MTPEPPPSLLRGCRAFVEVHKFTNMQMERLLGAIRQASGGRINTSDVEALIVQGMINR